MCNSEGVGELLQSSKNPWHQFPGFRTLGKFVPEIYNSEGVGELLQSSKNPVHQFPGLETLG